MATMHFGWRSLVLLTLSAGSLATLLPLVVVHSVCPMTCVYVPFNYQTIQEAVNNAQPGWIIYVSKGTYNGAVVVDKTLTIVGTGSGNSFIGGQSQAGAIITILASNSSISGFSIGDAGGGGKAIRVVQANNVSITNNSLSSDLVSRRPTGAGVDLYLSNHTLIDRNVFSYNLVEVNITRSDYNRVSNNRPLSHDLSGVLVTDGSHNLVAGNAFGNGNERVEISGALSSQNNITRNLFRALNVTGSSLVAFPTGNIFSMNNFMLNTIGVVIQNSTGNIFFQNNFVRNRLRHVNIVVPGDVPLNHWDNSTLGALRPGGNYWDNYTGTDQDNDGIGDTNLPADGLDGLPLMAPSVSIPLAVVSVTPSVTQGLSPLTVSFSTDVVGSFTPYSFRWSFGDGTPNTNSTKPSHTYIGPGNYTVGVLVTDKSGVQSVASTQVLVEPGSSGGTSIYLLGAFAIAAAATVTAFAFYWKQRRSRGIDKADTTDSKRRPESVKMSKSR